MNLDTFSARAAQFLNHLCLDLPNRAVGAPGNQAATDFVARQLAAAGWQVECPAFDCLDWASQGASLMAGSQAFTIFASPYSLGGAFSGPLHLASTLAELEAAAQAGLPGGLLLLSGELTKEQLMPKNFPFYNPPEHQHLRGLLEKAAPLAILTATTRNPELAGAVYPFPLIEDGDFDIPSAYLTDEEGQRLVQCAGQTLTLEIQARRIPSTGCNVVARRLVTEGRPRVVLSAHIDAKLTTPGALDNAAGVTTLLLLADLLDQPDAAVTAPTEILIFNGEDYYAAPGEILYLRSHQEHLNEILVNINLDGLGYLQGRTAYSFYECSEALAAQVRQAFAAYPGLLEGEPWYQGDHMVFVGNGVPAIAITTEMFADICAHITHTASDLPELVDPAKLAETAFALRDLLRGIEARFNH